MKMTALLTVCLCLASAIYAQAPVSYGNYDNSSTAAPLENDPHKMGEMKPMIVPHGSGDADVMHSGSLMHSDPVEAELDTENPSAASENSSDSSATDFLNMSSSEMGDNNSTEQGPSTKATHIMVIPRKNMTMDGDNTTDSSMDKEASAATSEHDTHSKGAGSSASALVVLTLFTLSSRVLLSQ